MLAGTPAPCASGGGAVSSTTPPQGLENQSLVRQFPSLIVCEDQPGPIQHPGEAQLMLSYPPRVKPCFPADAFSSSPCRR